MADRLPRNHQAGQNRPDNDFAAIVRRREDELRARLEEGVAVPPRPAVGGGFQGIGRPPGQGNGAPRPPGANPFTPRQPDPERQKRLENAAPLPINSRAGTPMPPHAAQIFPPRAGFAQRPALAQPPAAQRPVPATPQPMQPRPQPVRNQLTHQWVWLLAFAVILVLIRSNDDDSPQSLSAPIQGTPPLVTFSESAPTMPALPESLEGSSPVLFGAGTDAPPTLKPCTVSAIEAVSNADASLVEGGGLKVSVSVITSDCDGKNLLVGIWVTHADGQLLLAPNADRSRYRLENGQVTMQAIITPVGSDATNSAEFVLPFNQLPLASGEHVLNGYADVRFQGGGVSLYRLNIPNIPITIP